MLTGESEQCSWLKRQRMTQWMYTIFLDEQVDVFFKTFSIDKLVKIFLRFFLGTEYLVKITEWRIYHFGFLYIFEQV